jgi:hypothetical protein
MKRLSVWRRRKGRASFLKKRSKKLFLNFGRAGFAGTGPVSRKFLRRFFQKAAAFF